MQETEIGGNGSRFPETQWSRVLAARGSDDLDGLLRTYWRPVYAVLRQFHRLTVEDAKDATQEFFAVLLARDFLKNVDSESGRFRAFLRTALTNFLRDRHRIDAAAKRGGGLRPLPVEEVESLLADEAPPPDRIFDVEWRRSVLDLALRNLEERLKKEGKEEVWRIFRSVENDSGKPSYKQVATSLGTTEDRVRNGLHYARASFREEVLNVLRESVSSEGELEAEIRDLF